jgi:hypothetical protein
MSDLNSKLNDRIKDMMLSKGLHKNISSDCQNRIVMLSEMIIKECSEICGSQADRRNILKAFGLPVESNIKYPSSDPSWSIETQYDRPFNLPKD